MRQRWLRWWQTGSSRVRVNETRRWRQWIRRRKTGSNEDRVRSPADNQLQQRQVSDDRGRGAETADHEKESLTAVAGEAAL